MKNRLVWFLLALFMLSFVGAASPPAITTQPQSWSIPLGQPAVFAVVASGDELGYQWQRNGQDIPGATQAIYMLQTTTLADSGSTFQVRVTNEQGTVVSCTATLTVIESGMASSSPPACPEPPSSGGGGGGGCGGGGGGGGSTSSSSGSSGTPGDPQDPGLPPDLQPYPVTRWKGSVKATQTFAHTQSGDHHTLVIEGEVTFESSPYEVGLYPTSIASVEGSLSLRREGVGGGCDDTVDATGTIGPNDGLISFRPDVPWPQHPTQLLYAGAGQSALTGTQVRSCSGGGGGTMAWTEYMQWLFFQDQTTSLDLAVLSGTYVDDKSTPGATNRTTYEWHLVKQR